MLVKRVDGQLQAIMAGSSRWQTLPGKSGVQQIWIFNRVLSGPRQTDSMGLKGKKNGVWEQLLLATVSVFSCESGGQLKWGGLGQVRILLVWGAGRAPSKGHRCPVASWGPMGTSGMRGRAEVSCGRERCIMKIKRLDKLKVCFAENTPAVKMLC